MILFQRRLRGCCPMPGLPPAGQSLLLARKSNQKALEYLRQNSLRAVGAPFRQLAASQFGGGVIRHFALLVLDTNFVLHEIRVNWRCEKSHHHRR